MSCTTATAQLVAIGPSHAVGCTSPMTDTAPQEITAIAMASGARGVLAIDAATGVVEDAVGGVAQEEHDGVATAEHDVARGLGLGAAAPHGGIGLVELDGCMASAAVAAPASAR